MSHPLPASPSPSCPTRWRRSPASSRPWPPNWPTTSTRCRSAAGSLAAALGGDEGWAAGAAGDGLGLPAASCVAADATTPLARHAAAAAVAAYRAEDRASLGRPPDGPPPMTAPLGGATPALHAVAGWDVGLLRGAVGALAAVRDRLLPWRARLEGVGRRSERRDCWSGPAARQRGGRARRGVGGGLGRGRRARRVPGRLPAAGRSADEAQDCGRRRRWPPTARHGAATADRRGRRVRRCRRRRRASARGAREAASAAAARGGGADAAPRSASASGTRSRPADFADLLAHVARRGAGPRCPRPPARRTPARWPRGGPALSAAQQQASIRCVPGAPWARSTACPPGPGTGPTGCSWTGPLDDPRTSPDEARTAAAVVAERIAAEEAAGRAGPAAAARPAAATGWCWRSATWTPPTTSPSSCPGIGNTAGRTTSARLVGDARRRRRGRVAAVAPAVDGRRRWSGSATAPRAARAGDPRPGRAAAQGGPALAREPRRAGGGPRGDGDRAGRARRSWRTATARSWSTRRPTSPGRLRRRRRRPARQPRDGGRRGEPRGAGGVRRGVRRPIRSPALGWFGHRTVGAAVRRRPELPVDPRHGALGLLRPRPSRRWPPIGEVVAGPDGRRDPLAGASDAAGNTPRTRRRCCG